ncbi:MAG: TSUP family transporter [Clostridia bacterium]|nr:TSUP family transporter [Clostridia bacterium]
MMFVAFLVGVATGIISGFGIGGGSLLVLYLTAVMGVSQYTAGGINLLYFIGCAPAALIGHIQNKAIHWKATLWCAAAGVAAAIPASLLAAHMDVNLLRRLFGGILLYIGIKELRYGRKAKQDRNTD